MPDHQPYVPASQSPPELTARALIVGVALGLIFSASSVYLALKIGLTVSSSIPIAVLSITIFRALGRTSILENNIVQTTGSASDSVAAGVVFTIPAILLMGYDLDISRVAVLATVGGLMGVLMMIPLRRALIVKEHDTLIYPEGTACAEVLIAGEERGLQAKRVFQAFGVGFLYKFLMGGLKLWPDVPGKAFAFYPGAAIATEISPELLGVGYIIGPRIAGYLFAGGCFAYLVLAAALKPDGPVLSGLFGEPDFRHDHRRPARDVSDLRGHRVDRGGPPRAGDLDRRGRRRRGGKCRQYIARSEDGLPRRLYPATPTNRHPGRCPGIGARRRLDPHPAEPRLHLPRARDARSLQRAGARARRGWKGAGRGAVGDDVGLPHRSQRLGGPCDLSDRSGLRGDRRRGRGQVPDGPGES